MTPVDALRARAVGQRIFERFQAAGAAPVAADVLQPAETLLDLYGEDIRARAYVTHDPVRGEMMLRPDFTVPVVQAHMAHGADPARYTYLGRVFRKQDHSPRASEYLQAGFEVFDRADPSGADAEVFALFAGILSHLPLRAVTGDIGLIRAAVAGLDTSDARRAALMRHIWRPGRFRALLDRFAGRGAPDPARVALLNRMRAGDPTALIAEAGQMNGLRSEAEILARIKALQDDATQPPIPAAQVAQLDDLLALSLPARAALDYLTALDWPAIAPALVRLSARLDAMDARGIDTASLPFQASYGRTHMEYYDGFVFGFIGADDQPPVATGGRYDALTAVLGQGRAIPAVGGVIRPSQVAALEGAGA